MMTGKQGGDGQSKVAGEAFFVDLSAGVRRL